jgi:magnesium-transporting ATPase (P-type)
MNVPFFIFRAALYFAVWIFFTWRLTRMVTQPRYWLDMEDRRVFQRLSAIGLIVYVLLMTFAAVDWIMSLQPDWYSTIYGLIIIIAQALVTFSFSLAILPWLARKKPLSEVVNAGLYRDLGALLFTSVMGWAYLAFMQLLIIWSGNLPHEAVWYVVRSQGGWLWIGLFAFIFQFALPFVVLLSLRAKRNPLLLAALGIAIVVTNLVYYYWQVAPVFHPEGFTVHWLDFVTPIGIGGIWMAAFLWYLERTPVLLPHGESLELLKSEEEHPAVAE